MKPKKYPSKNLNNKKTIFFQMGLIVALISILILVEWKTKTQTNLDHGTVTYHLLENEEMLIVKIPEKKLQPISEFKPESDKFFIDEKEPELQEVEPQPKEPESKVIPFKL